ncbi:MAG: T9SS type A sorting domain-containing protein [Vicingus serpentipes]|nr:T9SS type A sorting domain-containing protein [Vicingus serpentipes]
MGLSKHIQISNYKILFVLVLLFSIHKNTKSQVRPGGVANTTLELWLKADAGTNCTTDACGITSWTDQSPSTNSATGTGNTTYLNNSFNYNPSLNFTNDAQPISGSITRTNGTGSTIFVVGNIPSITDKCLIEIGTVSNRGFWMDDRYAGNAAYSFQTDVTSIWVASDPGSTSATPLYQDGRNFHTMAKTYNTDWTTGAAYYLGDDRTGGNQLTGNIAEVIFYDQQLSAADQQKVESYLAIKYGVTLSNDNDGNATTFEAPNGNGINEGDYVNSSGTVIWDASANSTYHFDVTGIGRDDTSSLNQQKSLSENTDATVLIDKGGAFGSDNDFIIWGNDNGLKATTTVNVHPSYTYRLERIWKAQVTGTPGNVTLKFIIANNNTPADYALLIDGIDTDFSSGATAHTTGASISGDTITFTNVALSDGDFFTLASDYLILPPGTPGGVYTSLELWLKADAGTNCSTDACAITSWTDQSASSHDATGTGNTVYSSSFANYNPGLSFTDDAQPISGAIARSNGTASTIFVVGDIPTVNDKCLIEIGDGSNRGFWMDDRYAGNAAYSFQTNTASIWTASDPGGTTASPLYQNARNFHTMTKVYNTNWTSGTYYLGDDRTGGNQLTGNIAEVIFYDQQLSAADQQKVESYLAIKYGITLSNNNDGDATTFEAPNGNGINEGDYMNASGTVIWDASANSTYHFDVTGIGRDDLSELDQQKSLSENSDATVLMDKGAMFGSDNDFIVWGNDNNPKATTTINAHPSYTYRLERIWKAQVTGTPGNVTLKFIITNNNTPADYALLIDGTDTDFSSGATVHTTGVSISGDTITFTNVALSDGDFFTLASDYIILPPPAPGGVYTSLELWLKADAGTNCTTNGCAITSWTDQSSSSHDATGTGNTTYLTNSINYNPGLNFTDDAQPITGSITRADGSSGSTSIATGNIPSISDKCLFEAGDGSQRAYFMDRRYAGSTSYSFTTGEQRVFLASDPGASTAATIYDNGENIDTQTKANGTDWTSGSYELGDDNTGGNRLTAEMAEYIFYDQQLSAADQQQVESYLAIKYGITLSNDNDGDATTFEAPNAAGVNEGDYLNSSSTVIWDASTTTTYHNNIIGIARDDRSDLTQKQSHTIDDTMRIYISSLAATNAANTGSFSADNSFVIAGSDLGNMCATPTSNAEKPVSVNSRIEREWKVQSTNFTDTFNIDMQLNACAGLASINVSHLRLLVDSDGDFSNASVYAAGSGLSFSNSGGLISITGISNTQIATNTTSYITLASIDAATPLPIELISFNAIVNEDVVDLTWQTATEINNAYFTIERSTDGKEWEEVIITNGAGNSNQLIEYFETDYNPLSGISYYRLKQTDFDGKYEYFNIVPVKFEKNGNGNINLFPNPLNPGEIVTIEFSGIEANEFLIVMRDVTGKEFYSKMMVNIENGELVGVPTETDIPAGVYIITATSENQIYSQKLLVK